jgi:peptidoglycan/LPS O-acetylase OafA/YrhL
VAQVRFHTYHKPFTGGFVRVDVFFVISGFLITNLLLKDQKRAGRFSISGFYARRVRWILPASILVVVITLFGTYDRLGFIAENYVANDSKWTAILRPTSILA